MENACLIKQGEDVTYNFGAKVNCFRSNDICIAVKTLGKGRSEGIQRNKFSSPIVLFDKMENDANRETV